MGEWVSESTQYITLQCSAVMTTSLTVSLTHPHFREHAHVEIVVSREARVVALLLLGLAPLPVIN